jgi:hypothetical protein
MIIFTATVYTFSIDLQRKTHKFLRLFEETNLAVISLLKKKTRLSKILSQTICSEGQMHKTGHKTGKNNKKLKQSFHY